MDTRIARTGSSMAVEGAEAPKSLLRSIHHLALNTSDMRMTLDFYVRVLGMPLVHGMKTPVPPPGAGPAHGEGTPPWKGIPHFFLDMGNDSLLAFFEYPKGIAQVDRDTLGAMQHVSFVCGPKRHRELLQRVKASGARFAGGPVVIIPPAITSFYFFDPNGIRLEIVADYDEADEEFGLIRSCQMTEDDMRAQLASITGDSAWIDGMIVAMSR